MRTLAVLAPEDWAELRDIRMRALADAPDAFGVLLADVEHRPDETWRDRLAAPDPILVVRDDVQPVAMGGGWVPPDGSDRMMIWGMWTAPEARGRGHARALVTWLLDWATQREIGTVELHVAEGNDTARRLYEQCGFEATGEWEPLRSGSTVRIELLRRRHPAAVSHPHTGAGKGGPRTARTRVARRHTRQR